MTEWGSYDAGLRMLEELVAFLYALKHARWPLYLFSYMSVYMEKNA